MHMNVNKTSDTLLLRLAKMVRKYHVVMYKMPAVSYLIKEIELVGNELVAPKGLSTNAKLR